MPDGNREPSNWRKNQEEEKVFWQNQEEYWERYRKWQEQKERERWEKIKKESNYWALVLGIIAIFFLCFVMMISM